MLCLILYSCDKTGVLQMSCVFRVWLSEIRLHVIGTLGLERIKLPTIVESVVNLKFGKDKNDIIVKRTVI